MAFWKIGPSAPVRLSDIHQFIALRDFLDSDEVREKLVMETSPTRFLNWLVTRAPYDCAHAAWVSIQALTPNATVRVAIGDLFTTYRTCLERAISSFEGRATHEEFLPRFNRI